MPRPPLRIALRCSGCDCTVAVMSTATVQTAAKFTGRHGLPLSTVLEEAARRLDLLCPMCEARATAASVPDIPAHPTLPGL